MEHRCEDCDALLDAIGHPSEMISRRRRFVCPDCGSRWVTDPRGGIVPAPDDAP